jgi:ssDNA-binding Zn-finger/Zn-ribbon topoisomerase 1
MTISVDNKYVRLISGRLRNFKQKKENLYNFSCPLCGDSQKNKLKARGYAYQKGNDLFYRCHNCNAGTNIAGLLKHVDTQLHSEYILERYKSGQANNSNTISEVLQLSVPKFGKIEKKKVFEHAEWLCNLPEEHFALKYATNRKIPAKFYDKLLFTSHYNQFITTLVPNHGKQILDDARLVIPFYDENNELIAVSGRALETSDKTLRYVTIRTNDNQNKLIYGMDRVDLSKRVYVCEGPIDSMFIDNCVASGDANLAMTAKSISADEIVLIFDQEPRNKEIVKMIQTAIKMNHTVVIWPDTIGEKDINSMIMSGKTPGKLLEIISSNSFSGIQAQLKFNMWKKV